LENGVAWTYRSTALQLDCLVITNCPPGQPPVLVENLLDRILFLSSADAAVVDEYPTPYGERRRSPAVLELGGTVGQIFVTAVEDPENGPVLTAFANSWPKKMLWEWHGPKEVFAEPDPLAITTVPTSAGLTRIAVAGRDGHVYQLDEKGHLTRPDIVVTPTSLSSPPDSLFAWNDSGHDCLLTVFHSVGSDSDTPVYHAVLADANSGQIRWQKDLGKAREYWSAIWMAIICPPLCSTTRGSAGCSTGKRVNAAADLPCLGR
jgi:hypothetical protein